MLKQCQFLNSYKENQKGGFTFSILIILSPFLFGVPLGEGLGDGEVVFSRLLWNKYNKFHLHPD